MRQSAIVADLRRTGNMGKSNASAGQAGKPSASGGAHEIVRDDGCYEADRSARGKL
jgi:hypothetical protein